MGAEESKGLAKGSQTEHPQTALPYVSKTSDDSGMSQI